MSRTAGSYFAGFISGTLCGIGLALLMPKDTRPSIAASGPSLVPPVQRNSKGQFVSRREGAESAGDPARVAGARFTRQGGAPGPRAAAETTTAPGRHGEVIDHSDASRGVSVARRALQLHNS